jgi:hypothetical protein
MNERRFECRFLCADMVRVEWKAAAGPSALPGASGEILRTVEAVLEDISALGACVQVEEPIPPGISVSMSFGAGNKAQGAKKAQLSGSVSYCVYRDYGYFVGIQFSNEMRWSSGIFEPQHLTNLEALMLTEPGMEDHAHTN